MKCCQSVDPWHTEQPLSGGGARTVDQSHCSRLPVNQGCTLIGAGLDDLTLAGPFQLRVVNDSVILIYVSRNLGFMEMKPSWV